MDSLMKTWAAISLAYLFGMLALAVALLAFERASEQTRTAFLTLLLKIETRRIRTLIALTKTEIRVFQIATRTGSVWTFAAICQVVSVGAAVALIAFASLALSEEASRVFLPISLAVSYTLLGALPIFLAIRWETAARRIREELSERDAKGMNKHE